LPVQPVAFYKDKEGIVHLQGAFQCPSDGDIAFTLPAGYRPTAGTILIEAGGGGPTNVVISGGITSPSVLPAGAVAISGSTGVDASGVDFRPGS
jgi:hypothetical protein